MLNSRRPVSIPGSAAILVLWTLTWFQITVNFWLKTKLPEFFWWIWLVRKMEEVVFLVQCSLGFNSRKNYMHSFYLCYFTFGMLQIEHPSHPTRQPNRRAKRARMAPRFLHRPVSRRLRPWVTRRVKRPSSVRAPHSLTVNQPLTRTQNTLLPGFPIPSYDSQKPIQ